MIAWAHKLAVFVLALAVIGAPALCNCAVTPEPVARDPHACCKHDEQPADRDTHQHGDHCDHCNPTIKVAIAEQLQHHDASIDFSLELIAIPTPFDGHLTPHSIASVAPASSPPLLLDLFHSHTALLN